MLLWYSDETYDFVFFCNYTLHVTAVRDISMFQRYLISAVYVMYQCQTKLHFHVLFGHIL